MTSRRPLVLELGGNTILFRLLTKPSFCSFPLLDDRKAPNGGICTEREEVSEEHEELNKIILFLQCPAGGEVVRTSAPTGALPKIVTETRGAGLRPAGNESGYAPDPPGRCEPNKSSPAYPHRSDSNNGAPRRLRARGAPKC